MRRRGSTRNVEASLRPIEILEGTLKWCDPGRKAIFTLGTEPWEVKRMDTGRVLRAGIVASIVMGMIEMIYEAVAGAGFWSPVVLIGATVLRGLQSLQAPVSFQFGGVVLGLMGHMMNSVILGLIFAAIFSRSAMSRGSLVGVGVVYALAVFLIMWYVVVPSIDPVMRQLNGTVFAIAHVMWGAALGWFVSQPSGATVH